ncbi:hypothetical protein ACOSQ4_028532 [Xanthoceras sorbifolium]
MFAQQSMAKVLLPQNRGRRGRGRWNNNGNRPTCQICSRISHTAIQCYNRYERNAPQGPTPSQNQSGFNGPHGAMQVHSQIPPSHGVAEYNYFLSPAQNSFNQGQFQPQHQVNYN